MCGLAVAAIHGNHGKSGYHRSLEKKGLTIWPIEAGTDGIKEELHRLVVETHPRQLDRWMYRHDYLIECFRGLERMMKSQRSRVSWDETRRFEHRESGVSSLCSRNLYC